MAYLPTDWNDYPGANDLEFAQGPSAPGGLVNTSPMGTPWNVDASGNQYDQNGQLIGPTTPGAVSGNYGRDARHGGIIDPGTGDQTVGQPTGGPDMGGVWGGPVAPFSGSPYPDFQMPELPQALRSPYALPTAADLQASPGYMARYQQGLDARQRSAAARGTLLNGGTIKALTRYGQDYASGEFDNLVKQSLAARQQQASDYLTLAYGPAWQQNQGAVNKYGSLYGQYQDLINNNRNAQNDYWQQQKDILTAGLGAAGAGNPGTGNG